MFTTNKTNYIMKKGIYTLVLSTCILFLISKTKQPINCRTSRNKRVVFEMTKYLLAMAEIGTLYEMTKKFAFIKKALYLQSLK